VVVYLVATQVALLVANPLPGTGWYPEQPNHVLVLLTVVLVGGGVQAGLRRPRPVLLAASVVVALVLWSASLLPRLSFDGPFTAPLGVVVRGAQTAAPLAGAVAALVAALVGLRGGRSQPPVVGARDPLSGGQRSRGAVIGLVAYLAVTKLMLLTWVDTYPVPDDVVGVLLTAAVVAVGVLTGVWRPRLALPAAVVVAGLVLISAVIGSDIWLDESARSNPLNLFFIGAWTSAPMALATGTAVAAICTVHGAGQHRADQRRADQRRTDQRRGTKA